MVHYRCICIVSIAFIILLASPARGRELTESFNRVKLAARLGSSPPSCRSKCGGCNPCKAVNVPIQRRMIMPTEYYPEAWRCQCGSKLFLP